MPGALSLNVVTSQSTVGINVIQAANLSDSITSNIRLPCHLHRGKTYHRSRMGQLDFRQKGTSTTQKSLIFSMAKEGGRVEGGSSHAYSDDQVLTATGNFDTSKKNPVVDVASSQPSNEGPATSSVHPGKQGDILDKLKIIYMHLLASEQWNSAFLKKCNRIYVVSGTNLIHYLALKSLDLEQLKEDLISNGLVNLDTITPYILPVLTACIQNLGSSTSNSMNGEGKVEVTHQKTVKSGHLSIGNMRKQSSYCRERLLGPLRDTRTTHIMVTVGEEALGSHSFIPGMLASGATVVRINCAHGNPTIWSEITKRVRKSSQELEKPCRILMDLAGPKLRTGKLKASPCGMKISPKKTATGEFSSPAQVWLSYKGTDPPAHLSPDAVVYLDNEEFFSDLQLGDIVSFRDARGKQRTLKISVKLSTFAGVMSECTKTACVMSGTEFYMKRKGKKGKHFIGSVVDVPPADQFIRVKVGDQLIISRDSSMEEDKTFHPTNSVHRITCSSWYLFDSVKSGQTIAFDDGKIWGVIQGVSSSEIIVSVTHAGLKGVKLRSEKSINIPDSSIRFEGLTSKDLMDLEFVASQADMVGASFIRDVNDVKVLLKELQKLKVPNLGVVLKIETKSASEKLPLLLLEAMKCPNPLGVMIARGDLAVECGWERLADIQEEILSTSDAAHIPVIWATQVLESLIKSGVPTRAEITDVAAGRRASCIMLNKGHNIQEAVSMLDSILRNNSRKSNAAANPPYPIQLRL